MNKRKDNDPPTSRIRQIPLGRVRETLQRDRFELHRARRHQWFARPFGYWLLAALLLWGAVEACLYR